MMMVENTGTTASWVFTGAMVATCSVYVGLIFLFIRRQSNKAKIKRRLLVIEDGHPIGRTVRGALLVGSSYRKRQVNWGMNAKTSDGKWADWAVIQITKGKFVVYRFDDRPRNEPHTGTIQIVNSWLELEAAVPARIFEEAMETAGFRKPEEYKELPLKV
jgi:hypothetical protein